MEIKEQVRSIALAAKTAAGVLARLAAPQKNAALRAMADGIEANESLLLEANAKDCKAAQAAGLAGAMLDRLTLQKATIRAIAAGIREVALLPDPVGEIGAMWRRPNGLLVGKMRIPLGVIGIIYEARPNVTADAAALCLKSSNAVILRGGSEALHSNMALGWVMNEALVKHGLPAAALQVVPTTDRQAVHELLQMDDLVDLIIPRGGEELIRAVVAQSKIPVIKHYKGVCHIFVDEDCNTDMALEIAMNAKTQRPGVCNAMETLLVHEKIAVVFLPLLAEKMAAAGVEIRGCERTLALIKNTKAAAAAVTAATTVATTEDWYAEYLDLILAVKVVASMEEAISHIEKYGSLHTEAIITNSYARAQCFLREVNSSTVLVNASTRFSDGFELGLGAEIGISTTKLHAFGPMGLEGLTTTKFIVYGDGQVRK